MASHEPIQLIVNADDYGYFPCVSRGILHAAKSGAITATGILATHADSQLTALEDVDLDLGVHLNLSCGQALTSVMRAELTRWQGVFPNAYLMSGLILMGKIAIKTVREEWRAQIEVCQSRKLWFLNSHEHIHTLPVLFPLVLELAKTYNIPHIRLTRAEWLAPLTAKTLIRNSLIHAMQILNQSRIKTPMPLFLGLSQSGKLSYDGLNRLFSTLKAGQCYELMCHPGYFDAAEMTEPRLLAYHDWEAELAVLQSPQLQELYQRFNIRLSHYHHLEH